jgi:glycosyltransferase involved in cell wall biosynthesis
MDISKLKQLAESLGVHKHVIWRPEYIPHEELPALLATADMFLLPYRSIDASAVLSMVLPYGKPIIASRLGIFKESVEQEGYGILVNPQDPKNLAESLKMILTDDDLYAAFCVNAKQAALQLPSWADMARELVAAYRSLGEDRA